VAKNLSKLGRRKKEIAGAKSPEENTATKTTKSMVCFFLGFFRVFLFVRRKEKPVFPGHII